MLFPVFTALALTSGVALAAPTKNEPVAREVFPYVPVTFNGAAGASYTLTVEANGVSVLTNNALSITSISMEGRASFFCTAYGIDGSVTELFASQQNVPVGPPQTQVSVVCSAPPSGY